MDADMSFAEILEILNKMSLEEQEALEDVLHRRIIERRREEFAQEIKDAQREFQEGKCQPTTPEDLMKEILS